MAANQNAQISVYDNILYCEEEEEFVEVESEITFNTNNVDAANDEQLQFLKEREEETSLTSTRIAQSDLSLSRKHAVEWMIKIKSHYGFSALTAILAVNYLDRFLLNRCLNLEKERTPWMMQLVAVASLSLAAKVEEIRVPLLLDLQVEDAKYLFEAKSIQKMELLILSALKWRMNPVTPLSYLHHIVRRFGFKAFSHWKILRSCENLILSLIPDSRFIGYLPSVMAAATMLYVVNEEEGMNAIDEYEKDQILCLLKISKEEVDKWYEVISDVVSKQKSIETQQMGKKWYNNGFNYEFK